MPQRKAEETAWLYLNNLLHEQKGPDDSLIWPFFSFG